MHTIYTFFNLYYWNCNEKEGEKTKRGRQRTNLKRNETEQLISPVSMMTRRCWSRWNRFPHFPFQIWISDERAGSAARTRTPSPSSVTRLGNFLKFWVKIFVTKVAQMYSDFWAILKTSFQLKQRLQTFWASFFYKKIGLLFISASGHTVPIVINVNWTLNGWTSSLLFVC